MEDYRMSFMISSVLEMGGSSEMIYGYVPPLPSCSSTQANGVIRGKKWMSLGKYGMSKIISLFYILMFCLVSWDRRRANGASNYTCPIA